MNQSRTAFQREDSRVNGTCKPDLLTLWLWAAWIHGMIQVSFYNHHYFICLFSFTRFLFSLFPHSDLNLKALSWFTPFISQLFENCQYRDKTFHSCRVANVFTKTTRHMDIWRGCIEGRKSAAVRNLNQNVKNSFYGTRLWPKKYLGKMDAPVEILLNFVAKATSNLYGQRNPNSTFK